jgi:hypothetical protein
MLNFCIEALVKKLIHYGLGELLRLIPVLADDIDQARTVAEPDEEL